MKKHKVKQKTDKKLFFLFFGILGVTIIFFFTLFVARMVFSTMQPDKQCLILHDTPLKQPTKPDTAKDFFELGNFDYERGNCKKAIVDYTKAIEKNPKFAESYNNRAYTYMRMQRYKDALTDLDQAISLRPDYVRALMNRGDIYNYYYSIDRQKALKDYNKVLTLVSPSEYRSLSLCGHRLLAQNNGWSANVFLTMVTDGEQAGCKE